MTARLVVGLLVVHNVVTNLWVGDRWYVPVNLATAATVVVVGGRPVVGGWSTVLVGVAGALVVVAGVAVAAATPATRPLLADRRVAGIGGWGTAWRALVRIPLGTVVLEEVAFRGVLPAVAPPVVASVLFGAWHVIPTVRTLDVNDVARSGRARALAVGGAVAATTVVGLGLCWLRSSAGGLAAPALVHAAANSGATVAAYGVLRVSPTGR